MKGIIVSVVLLFAITMVAQQMENQLNPSTDSMSAAEQSTQGWSNSDVMHQIAAQFQTSPEFSSTDVSATVNDNSIRLSGYVASEEQRVSAQQLAEEYSGGRTIVNDIQVGGTPGEGF